MPVLLAGMLFVLVGMTGLAVDHGFATLERRVLQNGVDAAALSGASDLARDTPQLVLTDVQTIATRNGIAATATIVCEFIDNLNAVTGPCSAPPSGTTSGVKVTATNDKPTYFMRMLGVSSVTVSTNSMARVFTWEPGSQLNAWNSLFVVCGVNTTRAVPKVNGNGYTYDNLSILKTSDMTSAYPATWPYGSNAEWPLNPALASLSATQKKFVIHDESSVAKCGIGDSGFKGLNSSSGMLAVPTASGSTWAPTTLIAETGTRSGPVTEPVKTYQGCPGVSNVDAAALNNCVMVIPVFTSTHAAPNDKVNGDYRVHGVRWLPFWIEREVKNGPNGNTNTHFGTLLPSITLQMDSHSLIAPWTKNSNATFTVVRTVNS